MPLAVLCGSFTGGDRKRLTSTPDTPIAMTKPLRLLPLLVFLALPQVVLAQSAGLEYATTVNEATNQYEVTVRVSSNPPTGLGVSTIVFNFNEAALSFPSDPGGSELTPGVDYAFNEDAFSTAGCYGNSDVTRPLTGQASVNLVYNYTVVGLCGFEGDGGTGGTEVPEGGIDLVTIFLDIDDPDQSGELLFDQNNTDLFTDERSEANPNEPSAFDEISYTDLNESLPVEFGSLEATADGADVVLRWTTLSETSNAGFEVQHQRVGARPGSIAEAGPGEAAGSAWEVLTFVEGAGTSHGERAYTYRSANLDPGRYQFRLRQIDLDGASTYSAEVEAEVEMAERFVLEGAYPNPFNPEARFRFAVREAVPVRVELYDALGRRVATLYEGTPTAGQMEEVRIDGSGLPSGSYFVRLVGEGISATRKVVLLK